MVRRLYVRIVGVLMKPRLARGDLLVCALNFHFNCDQNLLLIGERESVKGPSSRHPKNRNWESARRLPRLTTRVPQLPERIDR